MKYKFFNNNKISYLGLGMMRQDPNNQLLSQKIVDFAITAGINYFEGCYFYLQNKCESILANCLQKYPRNSYYLCDKLPLKGIFETLKTKNELEELFQEQLDNMKTNYFDFYLIQAIDDSCINLLQKFNLISFLLTKKQQGIIKYLGFSFHGSPEILEMLLKLKCWDLVQLQLNYYDYYLSSGKENYNLCVQYNIPVWVMGGNKGGTLIKDINTSICDNYKELPYKFLNSLENIYCILSGADSLEILTENILTINNLTNLTKQDIINIEKILQDYKEKHYINCSKCNYCQPCPQGINIPWYFEQYNNILKYGTNYKDFKDYMNYSRKSEVYFKCLSCHRCEKKCPQHLPIPQLLKKDLFQMRF